MNNFFVRFDFSNIERLPVPRCLTALREKVTGIPAHRMRFWALEHAHTEWADVVEKSNRLAGEAWIANAEAANRVVRICESIRLRREYREEFGHILSAERLSEVRSHLKRYARDLAKALREYRQSLRRIEEADLGVFQHREREDYDACRYECWIEPYCPEVIERRQKNEA